MKQKYKSIYFRTKENCGKTVTLAFNQDEDSFFKSVNKLSSTEIREILEIEDYSELLNKSKSDNNINLFLKSSIKMKLKKNKINKRKRCNFF